MNRWSPILFCLLAVVSLARCGEVEIQDVVITFRAFHPLPDLLKNFKPLNPDEPVCDENGVFKGRQFMKPGDPSVIVIQDSNNKFVGTRTGFFYDVLEEAMQGKKDVEATRNWYQSSPQIQKEQIEGKDTYLMTAYIRDPTTLCSSEASTESTDLFIKHKGGEYNNEYVKVSRSGVSLTNDGWQENPCIAMMGTHYRYRIDQVLESGCSNWTPIFLIFNGEQNIGYGWNFPGNIKHPNLENSARDKFVGVMIPVPNCVMEQFDNNGGYSSQHVYLINNPQSVVCPAA